MTPTETLLQAAIANPDDPSHRLAYADYLESQSASQATAIRSHPEIFQIIAGMKRTKQAPFDLIEKHLAVGGVEFLAGLAITLESCRKVIGTLKWPEIIDCTLDHVDCRLALTPDTLSVETLLRRSRTPIQCRSIASMIASGQSQSVLVELFDRRGTDESHTELLACLAHEMIVRGASIPDKFAQMLRNKGHPLAWLPMALIDIEGDLKNYLPQYVVRGSSRSMPFGPSRDVSHALPMETTHPLPAVTEMAKVPTSPINSAVRNWQEESNGKIELRAFHAARRIEADDLSVAFLQSLGLESLQGLETKNMRTTRVTPDRILAVLFSAASGGGAYSRGLFSAYGRLHAWQSMAGLVGMSEQEAVSTIAEAAKRCLWVEFEAGSEWFYQVAWDIGLVAVRPDREHLVVLAATDTD